MGTVFEIIISSEKDEYELRVLTEMLFENLDRYEKLMSLFIDGSDVDYINKLSGKRAVRISPEVYEIIKTAKDYSQATAGYFDITVGPLMKLWGFYRKRDSLPSEKEIRNVLAKIGYENIVLNDEEMSVFLKKEGMMVDLGGIAKGWSVRKLSQDLRKYEIKNFLVNAGMSSVYASGSPERSEFWNAEMPEIKGFKFPNKTITLKDNSVSVSGIYEKIVNLENHKFSHIINPKSGKPESNVLMTAVIGEDPLECEILSTAFCAMGIEKAAEFLNKKKGLSVIMVFFNDDNYLDMIKIP